MNVNKPSRHIINYKDIGGGFFMPGSRLQNKMKQMLYKPNKNKIFKALNLDAVRELGEALDKGIETKGKDVGTEKEDNKY